MRPSQVVANSPWPCTSGPIKTKHCWENIDSLPLGTYIRTLFRLKSLRFPIRTRPVSARSGQNGILVLCALALCCTGCVAHLGAIIAAAPNVHKPDLLAGGDRPPIPEAILGIDEHFRVEVGPPAASLSVSVMHPDGNEPPRGTILIVHGMGARSAWMHGKARALCDHGYRAVLVDLRGHGASTGHVLSYGLREARDLSYVIDALEGRGLISRQLGVYGISYGATTAIHLAAIDSRVAAVVAVAPFSDMRSEVSHYVRTIAMPGVGAVLSEETIQNAVDEAGEMGGFDPDQADAALAIGKTRAPVLLIHGKADCIIPNEHSRRLHEAAPGHSELLLLPAAGHLTVWMDPLRRVQRASLDWFDTHLR